MTISLVVRRTLPYVVTGLLAFAGGAVLTGKLLSAPSEMQTFADIMAGVSSLYVEPVDRDKFIENALKGGVAGLDPHSSYLSTKEFRDFNDEMHGEFSGIGIEVSMIDGVPQVVSPIEDTPAYRAGLQSGDRIVRLNREPTIGKSLTDLVRQMRGKPGTSVVLTVDRTGYPQKDVEIQRALVKVASVKPSMLAERIGYIRITQFQEQTASQVAAALETFDTTTGEPRGIILDLRNNPGGLLTGAVGVAGAFLPPNTAVVSTKGRLTEFDSRMMVRPDDYLTTERVDYLAKLPAWTRSVPLVVLINGGSASASEIVAGALQDHKRARLVGTTSFGKGSVQQIMPLQDGGALKLTISRYFTPSGRTIQAEGITPDVIVSATLARFSDPGVRESDLPEHLSGNHATTPTKEPRSEATLPKTGKDAPLDRAKSLLTV